MLRLSHISQLAVVIAILSLQPQAGAQSAASSEKSQAGVSPSLYRALQYRSLGFSRGGRSTAVAGVTSKPLVYYFGATGGGVWKTTDAGVSWTNVSDGFFEAGSIGAIEVAESDPNVVYVGTGSACPRGNISTGVGMYRSTDAGKTWKHIGIREAGLIGRIRVHPKDHNLVYVAALGHIFGPNEERGVFRSKDGGKTWEKVLYVSNKTGAVDLAMDVTNPRILFAAMWTAERKPWAFTSGGDESGLYRSADGGDTWTKLKGGLPAGIVGRIGVAVSPAVPDRVWALVEAPEDRGGIYRSDSGGETWTKINGERRFLQRAWYYIHIYADPKNADTVYVLNTGFYKSTDGGRTYRSFSVPHGDNHDLWINPNDPAVMINANDGGANVSFNGAASWSGQMNQPTAEFYRVTVDEQFPYRVYGAQQDNSTVSVSSRSGADFFPVGGGESGHIAVDPRGAGVVFAGNYGGTISRMDVKNRLTRSVRAYPESSTGQRAADMKYRYQWNAPIRISPHDPDTVYHASQHVHRTRDGGHSWETISPDLTRNDKSKQDYSGGPISRDNTGVEVYGTIFSLEESRLTRGLLWTGSDDGIVQVSRDNGVTWKNVTPSGMPEFGCVNMIDLSSHDPGRAFVAVFRYRQDDFKPYIFRTNNFGQSWDLLTDGRNGIPSNHFIRVVREDPHRKGLLYAGTEFGMYISFDDGVRWQPFQLNLPVTPVTDMVIQRKDLVVATQGRAFWALEDLTPLHQISDQVAKSPVHLFAPRQAYRAAGSGAWIHYRLAEASTQPVMLEIVDAKGKLVQNFTTRSDESSVEAPADSEEEPEEGRRFGARQARPTARAGLNRFVWNLAYPAPFEVPRGTVMWGGARGGPQAVPGKYQVRLKRGDWSQTQPLEIVADPRIEATQAHFQEQFDLALAVGDKVKELYDGVLRIRDVRKQATELGDRLEKAGHGKDAYEAARSLSDKLRKIEGELTQLQGEGGQDALNFPGKLDNQFVSLYSEIIGAAARPGAGSRTRFEDLKPELARHLGQLKQIVDTDLAAFNQLVRSKGVAPVILPADTSRRSTN